MSEYWDLEIEGMTAYQGARLAKFSYAKNVPAYLPITMCIDQPERIVPELAARNFPLLGKKAGARIGEQMGSVSAFPSAHVLDRPGWVGPYYVFPSGEVVAPADAQAMRAIFKTEPDRNRNQGDLKGWHDAALLIARQPLPMFVIALPLAAIVSRLVGRAEGLAVEVVDPSGMASAILPGLAAAVMGSVGLDPLPFSAVRADAERHRFMHSDGLVIVQDPRPELAVRTAAQARAEVVTLVRDRGYRADGAPTPAPVSLLMVTRESLVDAIGAGTPAGDAVADRLTTLRVRPEQPYGVFERLSKQFHSVSELAGALRAGVQANQGCAIRHFLHTLVEALASNDGEVREQLERWMAHFRSASRLDLNDTVAVGIADRFGLVYASAKLAQRYGVLPDKLRFAPAIMSCYRRYFASPEPPRAAAEVVAELAAREDALNLSSKRKLKRSVIREHDVFLRTRASGCELLVREEALEQLIPDHKQFMARSDSRALLVRDGKHMTTYRRLAPGIRIRMICFRLPRTRKRSG